MATTLITVTGNLSADPELRFLQDGIAVVNFSIATTPRVKNKTSGEWEDGETLWLRCTAWRALAENIAATLTKGCSVLLTGTLQVRSYERSDGASGISHDVDVDSIGVDLRWQTATVSRAARAVQAVA